MSRRPKRNSMKDLLLTGMLMLMLMLLLMLVLVVVLVLVLMLMLRGVHPGLIAHKIHVNSRRLGGHATRGFAVTIVAGVM